VGTVNYIPLANTTLVSSSASVSFSSIPGTYKDLILIAKGKSESTAQNGRLRLNGDSSLIYIYQSLSGNGTTASGNGGAQDQATIRISDLATTTSTSQLLIISHIMDYSSTDKFTNVISRANNADTGTDLMVSNYANSSAITSLTVTNISWSAGSTFELYGIGA
jgi:hypothetical protein